MKNSMKLKLESMIIEEEEIFEVIKISFSSFNSKVRNLE